MSNTCHYPTSVASRFHKLSDEQQGKVLLALEGEPGSFVFLKLVALIDELSPILHSTKVHGTKTEATAK